MLARERIEYLLDDGSFHELDMLARHRAHAAGLEERPYTDGVITGWGTVDGRKVFVFSPGLHRVRRRPRRGVRREDPQADGPRAQGRRAARSGLNDGAGARIQEGVVSLASYGGIFYRNVLASGVMPQITVILGPCAGGAVYSPAMTDFIFMVRETQPHVHHRPRRREDRDRRGRHPRGARRRDEPRLEVRRRHVRLGRREGVPRRRPLPAVASSRRTTSRSRRSTDSATTPTGCAPSCATSCRRAPNQPYDMTQGDPPRRRRRRVLRVLPALGAVDRVRLRPARRAARSASSATSR